MGCNGIGPLSSGLQPDARTNELTSLTKVIFIYFSATKSFLHFLFPFFSLSYINIIT